MDDWENEDFEPVIPNKSPGKVSANWEDEEDETLKIKPEIAPGPTPAQIEAQRQKALLEDERLQAQMKNAELEGLNAEQRKVRERNQIEEADAQLAEELFDGGAGTKLSRSKSSGLGGINLKNKDDHVNFGIMVATKMADSTSFCVSAFLKEILQRQKETLSSESLDELAVLIQTLRDSKNRAKETKKAGPSKKEKKIQIKKHEDTFGGKYEDNDKYASYGNIEDDYM